ncbi:MAG TPA: hypothetical protein VJB08_03180 [Candidatus Nanoarchaeia archaeon]|nr:hypothetical protein [Candidatus Nanoarchaeia archaeon]
MKARELFLEVHRPKIVSDYQLPHDDLHFDNTITELIFGGIFVGEAIFDHLNQEGTVSNLIAIKNEHRERLLKSDHLSIEGYREKWERHLDYESLIMDKMIDLEKTPVELLCVPSGRSFFHQQRMYSLMHQGHQLAQKDQSNERSQWFSQWDDRWFCKNGSTRFRLIDILQQYTDDWVDRFAMRNIPEETSIDDVYEKMQDLHRKKMISAYSAQKRYTAFIKKHPESKAYARFVSEAMEYNEELRLLRSQSIFDFIQGSRYYGKQPFAEFLDVLATRQKRIARLYGGKIHVPIKTD